MNRAEESTGEVRIRIPEPEKGSNNYPVFAFGADREDDASGKQRRRRCFSVLRGWRQLTTMQRAGVGLFTVFLVLFIVPPAWTSGLFGLRSRETFDAEVFKNTTQSLMELLSQRSHDVAVLTLQVSRLREENAKLLKAQSARDAPDILVRLQNQRAVEKKLADAQSLLNKLSGGHAPTTVEEPTVDNDAEEGEIEPKPVSASSDYDHNAPNIPPKSLNTQQAAIIQAYKWAWKGYKEYAWGKDELKPISHTANTWFDLALTMVDGLDTMLIMGLETEFNEARDWMKQHFTVDRNVDVNLFETTIRVLGGLLSTYHLSGDEFFKEKAVDLGDRLMVAFETGSGVPLSDVNLHSRTAHGPAWSTYSSTSEVTTIQMEFAYLSHITNNKAYHDAAFNVMDVVFRDKSSDGLVPIWIDPNSGHLKGGTITLGARGDSYYEYLFKVWLLTGKTNQQFIDEYNRSMAGVQKRLVRKTKGGITYVGELLEGNFSPKMDHLVCFLPGVLAMGAHNGQDQSHMTLATELAETCVKTYKITPTGLAPEISHFNMDGSGGNDDIIIKAADAHNLLRPETVESLFYLWRLTKNQIYRNWGWEIFQAFERHCRVESGGYTSLDSVLQVPPRPRDKMESFFLGETLKYLFLLFSDDSVMPLDKYIWNTEAHAFPVFTPSH